MFVWPPLKKTFQILDLTKARGYIVRIKSDINAKTSVADPEDPGLFVHTDEDPEKIETGSLKSIISTETSKRGSGILKT